MQSNAAHKHKPQEHVHLDTHTHTAKIFPALHKLSNPFLHKESHYVIQLPTKYPVIQIQKYICAYTSLHKHIHTCPILTDGSSSSSDLWRSLLTSDTLLKPDSWAFSFYSRNWYPRNQRSRGSSPWPQDLLNAWYLFLSSRKMGRKIPTHQPD